MAPFLLLFLNFAIWALYGYIAQKCYPRVSGNRFIIRRVFNRVALSFGISMWLIYPTITGFFLQCINCFGSLEDGEGDIIV